MSRFRTLLLATLVVPAAPLRAQDLPQAVPTPSPLPSPTPTAAPAPTSVEPTIAPFPTPTATPSPSARTVPPPVVRPSPRPIATPTPRSIASPAPRATPTSAPNAAPMPTPTPAATAAAAAPSVIASPLPTTDERPAKGASGWPWMLGAAALLVGGIGLWLARRQRTPEDEEIGVALDAQEAEAVVPVAPVPQAEVADPGLSLRFRPTRVGFNMLSATAEGELTIVNEGEAAIGDVRVRTALLGAHAGQDADLAAFLAEPIGRPDVPAFALAPGEARTVRVLAAAPRATLKTMVAAERPMFVPIFAVNLRAGTSGAAQAFAIGAERVDSAKLAPFWLDVPDRAYTAVAARPHGPALGRG